MERDYPPDDMDMDEMDYGPRHHARQGLGFRLFRLVVIFAVIAGLGYYFLGRPRDDDGLVVLKSDETPARIRPPEGEAGGARIDSRDSKVLGLLDGNKDNDGAIGREVLTPHDTAPEPPPIAFTPVETPTTDSQDGAQGGETATAQTDTASAPATAPATPAPKTASTTAPSPDNAPAAPLDTSKGDYYVQFAAFKKEENAKNAAAVLAQKHASRLDGVPIVIVLEGDFWRVVTEGMNRVEAQLLCRKLRAAGQDCITKAEGASRGNK